MSALGQKQTCAVHQPMSALPPKATFIATLIRKAPALSEGGAAEVCGSFLLQNSTPKKKEPQLSPRGKTAALLYVRHDSWGGNEDCRSNKD